MSQEANHPIPEAGGSINGQNAPRGVNSAAPPFAIRNVDAMTKAVRSAMGNGDYSVVREIILRNSYIDGVPFEDLDASTAKTLLDLLCDPGQKVYCSTSEQHNEATNNEHRGTTALDDPDFPLDFVAYKFRAWLIERGALDIFPKDCTIKEIESLCRSFFRATVPIFKSTYDGNVRWFTRVKYLGAAIYAELQSIGHLTIPWTWQLNMNIKEHRERAARIQIAFNHVLQPMLSILENEEKFSEEGFGPEGFYSELCDKPVSIGLVNRGGK